MSYKPAVVPCKCGGGCGLAFIRTPTTRSQKYAKDCPVRAAHRAAILRKSQDNWNAKQRSLTGQGELLICACRFNCGRKFSRRSLRSLYAPDCPHKRGEKPRGLRAPIKLCDRCAGISDRREKPRCKVCGKPWEPEKPLNISDFVTNKYLPGPVT